MTTKRRANLVFLSLSRLDIFKPIGDSVACENQLAWLSKRQTSVVRKREAEAASLSDSH